MRESPVVSLRNVSFKYNHVPVLEGVNFFVHEGEFVTVLGPNGGGKTTLIKIILGLLKPHTGKVTVFGKPPMYSRKRMGYVPQYTLFDRQFPVTVGEVVLTGLLTKLGGFLTRDEKVSVSHVLEEVDAGDLKDRPFADLSGGQRQKVLIARALVSNPDILLLDEPTNSVDTGTENKLLNLLKELNRRMTIFVVTHDMGLVSDNVKKVICVNRVVRVHPTSEISQELFEGLYGRSMQLVRHDKV
ncbi:MAG: ABC transporter [Spirochaetes bacterium]|nr:MAG: ABC transporter [Spirochaetota bacterium]